jgi:hypothetical protein
MKRGYIGLAMAMLIAVGAFLSLPSCGHDQKVVSLTITPSTFTFLEAYPTGAEQYTATATYIHPPVTKDVTSQATWTIDDGVVTMSTPGLFTPAPPPSGSPPNTLPPCGGGDISASIPEGTGGSGNIVIAVATVTVDDPNDVLCPGGGKLATLAVGVYGSGSVSSLPAGINDCTQTSGTCIATFEVGASVLLTASAVPVWQNCPTGANTNTCVVTIATGGSAVAATF